MKYAFLILAIVLIASCKKTTTPPTTPTNPNPQPQVVYHEVPNWIADTMIGFDMVKNWYTDTMYSYISNGKTMFSYKGVHYHIKAYEMQGQTFSDSLNQYYCDIFDMNNQQINADSVLNVIVSPFRHYNSTFQNWDTTMQTLICNFPPFPKDVLSFNGIKRK